MPKCIFFTGATGGLGQCCIKQLSSTGRYTIFACGTNEEKLTALGKYPGVIPVRADITRDESVKTAREQVGTHTGQLWAVVNFAGLTAFCSMVEGDCVNKAESLLAVNVLGMARVNRFFFDLVQAGGGRIINCTSEAGWMAPPPFAAPYYLSKHAAEAYSDSLRRELLYLGIPVIKIQPGPYETRMTQSVEDMYRQTLANTRFYSRLLPRVKPFMDRELKKKNDPEDLARIVSKAIEAPHPRLQYRAGTSLLLRLFQLLPDRGVDAVYRILGRCG